MDALNKNKAQDKEDKAKVDRDLVDHQANLNDDVDECGNIKKIRKMTQELIVENNTRLNRMTQALGKANSTKTRLRVEAQDQNHQMEEIE